MRRILLLFTCLCSVLSGFAQPQFNRPESAVYSYQKEGYFISNVESGELLYAPKPSQKGAPIAPSTVFKAGLSGPMGLVIVKEILYVPDGANGSEYVYGFNIHSGEEVFKLHIPGALQLNDITWDQQDHLYVTDRKADKIYELSLVDNSYRALPGVQIKTPNGIVFDAERDQLLVCNSVKAGGIYAVDVKEQRSELIIKTGYANLDGIAVDFANRVYVSSWGEAWKHSTIVWWDLEQNGAPTVLTSSPDGMADMNFNPMRNELIFPNWWAQSVTTYPLWKGENTGKISLTVDYKKEQGTFTSSIKRPLSVAYYYADSGFFETLASSSPPTKKLKFDFPRTTPTGMAVVYSGKEILLTTPLNLPNLLSK